MHRVLQISEIVFEIAKILAVYAPGRGYGSGDTRRPGDLAAIARTCKAWYEPSMTVLWEHLVSLDPIVSSLSIGASKSSKSDVRTRAFPCSMLTHDAH